MAPNPRMQRTRSSPSARHEPLTRHPLGARSSQSAARITLPWGLLIVATMTACSYAKTVPVIVAGREFPYREAVGLGAGITTRDAIDLLGDPYEHRAGENGEVLRYWARGRYGDRVDLLGFITLSKPHYYWECDVRLEFRNDRLYSVTHSMESRGPGGENQTAPETRLVQVPNAGA